MKIKLWMTAIAALCISAGFSSCSKDDEQKPEQENKDKNNGKVEAVVMTMDEKTATPENPAVASASTPTTVEMSLATTYTEPNGTTFHANPKASVKLTLETDTVRSASIADIVSISRTKDVSSQHTEGEVITTLAEQHYSLGGQTVRFQMTSERIDHRNTAGNTVTLPYLRLSGAKPGETTTAETRSTPLPHVTTIRLRPLPTTRGSIITEQAYDVSVCFTVDATPTSTSDDAAPRTLSFQADYVVIVENTTEYPDPQTTFASKVTPLSGTQSTASPFTLTPGATSMAIVWEQTSTYTWFNTDRMEQQAVSYSPQAHITLSLAKDTVTISGTKDELESISTVDPEVTSEGENTTIHTASQTYTLGGGQTITINWGYDTYGSIEVEGNTIALPYIELSQPELLGVEVTERPDVVILNKEAAVYEVVVRFRQTVNAQNASGSEPQSIEYVVKYMVVQEIQLKKVVYRKSWEWNTPHDNIILAWAPIVYRDRIYSDGKTFTDTFSGSFLFVTLSLRTAGYTNYTTGEFSWDGKKIVYHPINQTYMDSIFIKTMSVGVTNLAEVKDVEITTQKYISPSPGDWEKYGQNGLYDDGVNISTAGNVEFVGNDGASTKASGWYAYEILYDVRIVADYQSSRPPLNNYLVDMEVQIGNPDQFLVIDGKMINYLEFRGEPQTTIRTEDITMPNGAPARVYKLEGRQHFLDKNFYVAAIDTVYQFAPSASDASQTGVPLQAPSRATSVVSPTTSSVAPPYRATPVIKYGGAPRGMTVPPMRIGTR